MTAHSYFGPIVVTFAYFLVYYLMQVNQLRVKTRLAHTYKARGERFDRYRSQDRAMLAADRYLGNMLEHMGPFLTLFWLNALFVGTLGTNIAGGIYVGCRALYPWAMGSELGGTLPARVLTATVPGYLVLAYFFGALALQLV